MSAAARSKVFSSPPVKFFLLLLVILAAGVPRGEGTDVEWYISPTGSNDTATCGRSPDTPCSGLEIILNQSSQFDNGSVTCFLSSGTTDDRNSTTVYFMGGANFAPPICLMNWRNVRVVGLHSNTSITSSIYGAVRGTFEFINCTNITIENLNFTTSPLGRSILFFQATTNIEISGCSFQVSEVSSLGVEILHCAGEIYLTRNVFYGGVSQINSEKDPNVLALDVTHGCDNCMMPFSDDPYDFSSLSFSLMIDKCVFQDLTNRGTPNDDYSRSRNDAAAMRLRFADSSINNEVVVSHSNFSRILNSEANGVSVTHSGESANNTVLFESCRFESNRVRYGGGLSAYFYVGPSYGTLEIENCDFINNTADFEGGGVLGVFLAGGVSNTITISNSRFSQNVAQSGSAVFLLNNPNWLMQQGAFSPLAAPLVEVELRGCVFERNMAHLSNGVVEVLRIALNISGVSSFTGNIGSGVLLRISQLFLEGEVTFSQNTAITGGALNIRSGSKVDMSGVMRGVFQDNSASFEGGAIFADSSSAGRLASEYNHSLAQGTFGPCFLVFGNELRTLTNTNETTRFTFRGNTASSEGQNIQSYSLRGCLSANFVSSEIANQFFSLKNDGTVFYEVTEDMNPFQSTATGPSSLYFFGASTKCYKRVNGLTYLLPNCSHSLLNSTFYLHPDMRCGLLNLTSELSFTYALPGTGLRPTIDKLIAPWSAIDTNYLKPPEVLRSQCPEPNPGNLVLSPAPGEQFDLTVQLADQLLNFVSDTVYVTVEEPPGALIQLNGLQFGISERVFFTPNRALSGIALVGAPGTEGRLRVVASSQVLGQDVVLLIPFQLAHCPKGFFPPPTLLDSTMVYSMITDMYSETQRIPTDPYQPLACHCYSRPDSPVKFNSLVETFPGNCIASYTIELRSILWAGFLPESDTENLLLSENCPYPNDASEGTPIKDPLTDLIAYYKSINLTNSSVLRFDPIDVVPYNGVIGPGGGAKVKCYRNSTSEIIAFESRRVFSIEVCGQGFCKGNATSTWYVINESFPCMENRMGPLCGQCRPEYAQTLYSTTCHKCTDKQWQYYLSLAFTLFFGFLLVLLVIGLNIGASPTIDSFLFFVQATYLLLAGRNEYEFLKFLAVFHPDFTFDMCITPDLDGLTRLILLYVTPLYILFLMIVTLLLTCFKRVSRALGKHSILQGLWFLFLLSYLNIAFITFELLYCQQIGPTESYGNSTKRKLVLVKDASVQCFSGLHLPFAIIALILAAFFIVPLPIYVLIIRKIPKLKPISDVYCSCYKDNRRWWISLSLIRRLLLVMVGVFIQAYIVRHFVLLICIAVILVVTVSTWPYETNINNYFVLFVTWMLLLIAIITQPVMTLNTTAVTIVSFILVVFTILCSLILFLTEVILQKMKKKTVGKFYKENVRPHLKRYSQRLKDLGESMTLRRSDQHELEESTRSTASTFIPKYQTVDATSYREPLLDSQFHESENDIDKFGARSSVLTLTDQPMNSNGATYFPRKKFDDKTYVPPVNAPTTTEISTIEEETTDTNYARSHTVHGHTS